ncbi:membrane protein [Anopheles sinensis]|uniref:Membrane protein n=1 Tax=Anopheles sinensis TaxID=74873 RepID=A0A084VJH0_ANOSI|nr:membrane protein [Anopheles sinensis]
MRKGPSGLLGHCLCILVTIGQTLRSVAAWPGWVGDCVRVQREAPVREKARIPPPNGVDVIRRKYPAEAKRSELLPVGAGYKTKRHTKRGIENSPTVCVVVEDHDTLVTSVAVVPCALRFGLESWEVISMASSSMHAVSHPERG